MKTVRFVAVLLLLVGASEALSQGADALRKAKTAFDIELREVDRRNDANWAKVNQEYLNMLNKLVAHMEKTGDDFGVRPTKAEVERFTKEKTVPVESPLGTPELMQQARDRYHKFAKQIGEGHASSTKALTDKYTQVLSRLRPGYEARGMKDELRRIDDEMRRADEVLRSAGVEVGPQEIRGMDMPGSLIRGLQAMFLFDGVEDDKRRVHDYSPYRNHGDMIGAERVTDAAVNGAFVFRDEHSMLEVKGLKDSKRWSVSARIKFPLDKGKGARVLASGGYRKNHVVVDASGELGTEPGRFHGSGYQVNQLKGWHEVTVVCAHGGTVFLVDGKRVGQVKAKVEGRVTTFCNSGAGGKPLSGAVASILCYSGSISEDDVAVLAKYMAKKPEPKK